MGGPPPGWGAPPPYSPPPRKKHTLAWVLGLLATLVVLAGVAVVALVVVVPNLDESSSSDGPDAQSRTSTGPGCAEDSGNYDGNTVLVTTMAAALQKHDKSSFVGLAEGDDAAKAMQLWWTNVDAIGFTTGSVELISDPADASDPAPTSIVVAVGWHNKLDPSSGSGKRRTPNAASTRYRLSTERVSDDAGCHLAVTAWKPLSNAPWDVASKLYVVHTRHTVVAGERSERSEVDRISRYAETAATWNEGFFRAADHADVLDQPGYLIFLPSTPQQEQTWFRSKDAVKPKGWTGDVGQVAGTDFPLQGVNAQYGKIRVSSGVKLPRLDQVTAAAGTGRIIITASGRSESPTELTSTIVHEMVHSQLDNANLGYFFDGSDLDAATVEGAAEFVIYHYLASPGSGRAAAGASDAAIDRILDVVRSGGPSFDGRYPRDAVIYGNGADATYNYALSASTFGYLADAYGLDFAIQSINDAYLNGGGPFGGVVTNISKGGTITFGNPGRFEGDWAGWLRSRL